MRSASRYDEPTKPRFEYTICERKTTQKRGPITHLFQRDRPLRQHHLLPPIIIHLPVFLIIIVIIIQHPPPGRIPDTPERGLIAREREWRRGDGGPEHRGRLRCAEGREVGHDLAWGRLWRGDGMFDGRGGRGGFAVG